MEKLFLASALFEVRKMYYNSLGSSKVFHSFLTIQHGNPTAIEAFFEQVYIMNVRRISNLSLQKKVKCFAHARSEDSYVVSPAHTVI